MTSTKTRIPQWCVLASMALLLPLSAASRAPTMESCPPAARGPQHGVPGGPPPVMSGHHMPGPGMHGPGMHGPGMQGPGMHGPGMQGPGLDGPTPAFLRGIELSEAQRDQIFDIMHEQVPALRKQGKVQRKAQEELQQLGWAEKFDDARARTLTDSLAKAQAESQLIRLRGEAQILALLTPEQRKKAQAFKTQGEAMPKHAPGARHGHLEQPGPDERALRGAEGLPRPPGNG